jgi:hypothetical protein
MCFSHVEMALQAWDDLISLMFTGLYSESELILADVFSRSLMSACLYSESESMLTEIYFHSLLHLTYLT